ncbi:TPA: hypothetical protein DF272_03200 [Candidatus Falkowbacteria bacterium]|nr:hypothetical protein [Candidatus Falkowbacteria bacterium]
MTNKLLLSIILLTSGILTSGCTGDFPPEQEIDYDKDVKPLIESSGKTKVRGSCNIIDSKSTCVDFIGEIFTEERMKLSCAEGKFSLDACPYSDLGGCQATPGTVSEIIVWSYDIGGAPITAEEAGYEAKACNALPAAKWVLPDDLLNQ